MGRNPFIRDLLEGLFPSSKKPEPEVAAQKRGTPAQDKPTTSSGKEKTVSKKVSSTKSIFSHPRLGEITISRTRQMRRISVSVKRDGSVRLNIPTGYPLQAGLDFLAAKEDWVASALTRAEANNPNRTIAPPYLTRFRELEFHITTNRDSHTNQSKITTRVTADKIIVSFPENLPHDSADVQECTRTAILRALRSEAKELLPSMVADVARRHNFSCGNVTVRATHSRWGSCSSGNDISLSIFLVRLPDHLIEYIIIHELCHTIHKDHSARFHALAEQHLGGREKQLRAELRQYRPDII